LPSTPALAIAITPPPAAGAKTAGATTTTSGTTTITVAAAPPASPSTPAPSASAGVAGGAGPGVSIGAISPDLLVFNDTTNGDDGAVSEKKRIAAILDLPRPEMSISAWIMQNSSVDPDSVNEVSRLVRENVALYNEGLENTILRGWDYLKLEMASPGYFNGDFYNYISRRVVFQGQKETPQETSPDSLEQRAHDLLNEDLAASDSLSASPVAVGIISRQQYLGTCSSSEYCLGYTTLFQPLRARLTDLLLALVASDNPVQQLNCAIDHGESAESPSSICAHQADSYDPNNLKACDEKDPASPCQVWTQLESLRDRNKALPLKDPRLQTTGCIEADYIGTLQSMLRDSKEPLKPILFLNCFRRKASTIFDKSDAHGPVTELGLLRAAIADFLFNYKMSQQYPHEFVAYDLTTSAQAMNSALRPLVDSFVQDVTAYQAVLKRRLGLQIDDMNRHLTKSSVFDKPRFFNNAIVTVNTIANSEASSDTATESYLEALNPPTLSSMANALVGTSSSSAPTSGTALSGLLSATRLNEAQAIAAGLSQFQSSKIHLGRELSVDVKPSSLLGANSAELQVVLKADDEAGSGAYSSGGSGDAEVSRFGKSDTSTRVRVDSLKLFEVSSFGSELSVPKKRFPILPVPGLEMPYFGSILSLPLRPAREFHASMAVMSAIVIPTAADVAYTARFVGDRVLVAENPARDVASDISDPCVWPIDPRNQQNRNRSLCKTRPAVSLHDFNGEPIREYNRMIIHCFATGGTSATPNLVFQNDALNRSKCSALRFQDVLADVE